MVDLPKWHHANLMDSGPRLPLPHACPALILSSLVVYITGCSGKSLGHTRASINRQPFKS